jgi:hypothetical protein
LDGIAAGAAGGGGSELVLKLGRLKPVHPVSIRPAARTASFGNE